MRYAIFSDVHSNLEAFVGVLEFYKKEQIDKYIFLGDIIGYGADPSESIRLLRALGARSLAGNHDQAAAQKFDLGYFNEAALAALSWTRERLTADEILFLDECALIYREGNAVFTHGSLEEPQYFNYVLNISDARRNFLLSEQQLIFVGHSHKAQAYYSQDGVVQFIPEAQFPLSPEKRYIINVGSVGQPRDRDPRASCCVYDSQARTVMVKRVEYDIKKAADKIVKAGLPQVLASRLSMGW